MINKKKIISDVTDLLRNNGIKKPVHIKKHSFTVTDEDGGHSVFSVKPTDKEVLYTSDDVKAVFDAILTIIEDGIRHGEEVYIANFGSFFVHKRAERKVHVPTRDQSEWVTVEERYVPKFKFGNRLRIAARLYEASIGENANVLPVDIEYDDETEPEEDAEQ